jgi:hypothetical protein
MATKTVSRPAVRRLAEIAPAGGELTAMETIQDRDLKLVSADERETQYGRGYLMCLIDPETDEAFECLSSAVVIVKQLDAFKASGDPFEDVIVRFVKQGRCWIME